MAMIPQQSNLTFRLALETFEETKNQLIRLTDDAKILNESVSKMQALVQKKRREIGKLAKKAAGKRKTLVLLRKKVGKDTASSRDRPGAPLADCTRSFDDMNSTFEIEDISIGVASPEPASANKRKRFAGIWDSSDSLVGMGKKMKRHGPTQAGRDDFEDLLNHDHLVASTSIREKENVEPGVAL